MYFAFIVNCCFSFKSTVLQSLAVACISQLIRYSVGSSAASDSSVAAAGPSWETIDFTITRVYGLGVLQLLLCGLLCTFSALCFIAVAPFHSVIYCEIIKNHVHYATAT